MRTRRRMHCRVPDSVVRARRPSLYFKGGGMVLRLSPRSRHSVPTRIMQERMQREAATESNPFQWPAD